MTTFWIFFLFVCNNSRYTFSRSRSLKMELIQHPQKRQNLLPWKSPKEVWLVHFALKPHLSLGLDQTRFHSWTGVRGPHAGEVGTSCRGAIACIPGLCPWFGYALTSPRLIHLFHCPLCMVLRSLWGPQKEALHAKVVPGSSVLTMKVCLVGSKWEILPGGVGTWKEDLNCSGAVKLQLTGH